MINRRDFLKNIFKGAVPVIAGMAIEPFKALTAETPQEYIKASEAALDNGECEKAVKYLQSGMIKFPQDEKIKILFLRTAGFHASNLILKQEYKQAAEILEEAIKINTTDPWLYGLLGKAYFNLGEKRKAFDASREALKLNPDDFDSRFRIELLTQTPLPPADEKQNKTPAADKKEAEQQKDYLQEIKKLKQETAGNSPYDYQINRIVIDPSHGGFDFGGEGENLKEKDIVLLISKKLRDILELNGKKVFLTRDDDYYLTLAERTALANRYRADIFISIHCNCADNTSAKGLETYYCSEKTSNDEAERVAKFENSVVQEYDKPEEKPEGYLDIEEFLFLSARKHYWKLSEKKAEIIHQKILNNIHCENRGIHGANLFVLRNAKMPSALIETGFISNLEEAKILGSEKYQIKYAESIAAGLV